MLFKYAGEDKCALDRGIILKKNSVEEWNPFRHSIENSMNGGRILELYFVNSNHYNEQGVFYDCDSIFIKNDVLKHYKLTLEDLQRMEWKITYPPSGQ